MVFGILSGYTADKNIPTERSNGLFVASYIICILQCIIYFIGFIYVSIIGLYNCSNNLPVDENGESKIKVNTFLPLLLNIYWVVVHFNYDISDNYDEFAKIKTIEFFVVFGIFILSICAVVIFGATFIYKFTQGRIELSSSNRLERKKPLDPVPLCTQV